MNALVRSVSIAGALCLGACAVGSAQATSHPPSTPSALGFARIFVDLTNAYSVAHHRPARVGNADCVEPASGRYMCSYASTIGGRQRECHLVQARWTPTLASTFTVTLAGRVKRCESLRAALHSLP